MKKPDEPYCLETDEEGLNTDLAPGLVDAARTMTVYLSKFERPVRVDTPESDDQAFRIESRTTECVRCGADGVIIWPDTLDQRIGHLTRDHGYRMDGHRYDNENAMVA